MEVLVAGLMLSRGGNEGMNLILTLITESIEIEETIAEEPKRMGANNFIANSNSKNIKIPNLPQ